MQREGAVSLTSQSSQRGLLRAKRQGLSPHRPHRRSRHGPPPDEPPKVHRRDSVADVVDVFRASACARYSCFVLLTVLVTTVTLMATPSLLLGWIGQWKLDYYSLERDLRHSRDHSVHPCDDLYRHVCSGWDSNRERRHRLVLDKYKSAFDDQVITANLMRPLPAHSPKARDKVSALLTKCLSR
ncbi:hypothetical protein MTO96_045339, partial [Rhipicephalus appendiculatus]